MPDLGSQCHCVSQGYDGLWMTVQLSESQEPVAMEMHVIPFFV